MYALSIVIVGLNLGAISNNFDNLMLVWNYCILCDLILNSARYILNIIRLTVCLGYEISLKVNMCFSILFNNLDASYK